MKSDEILNKLRNIPLFESIKDDEDSLRRLVEIIEVRSTGKGKSVICEGELGTELYIVHSGTVEIRKRTRAGDEYTVLRLDSAQNVFFGELALVDDDRRSATVVTLEDSEFLVITKASFLSLGDEHPHIGLPVTRAIARILAERLRKTTSDMLTIFDALVTEIQ